MKTSGLVLQGVLVAAALAVVTPARAAEPTVADVGKGYFEQYCSSCHGPGGKGDGGFVPYLKVPPPDLTTIAKRNGGTFPETKVAEIIDGRRRLAAHGTADMPIWGQRFAAAAPGPQGELASSRGQIILFVAYLRSIQQK